MKVIVVAAIVLALGASAAQALTPGAAVNAQVKHMKELNKSALYSVDQAKTLNQFINTCPQLRAMPAYAWATAQAGLKTIALPFQKAISDYQAMQDATAVILPYGRSYYFGRYGRHAQVEYNGLINNLRALLLTSTAVERHYAQATADTLARNCVPAATEYNDARRHASAVDNVGTAIDNLAGFATDHP